MSTTRLTVTELLCSIRKSICNLIPGGAFVSGEFLPVKNPYKIHEIETRTLLGFVENSGTALVSTAVEAAHQSLKERWEPWKRKDALQNTASKLETIQEEAAEIVAAEGVKTISEARQEVQRAVHTLKLSATAIENHIGETLNLETHQRGSGRVGFFEPCPLGVVAAITPFNDPLNLVAHKAGPALASGNAVVIKPAEQTPYSALLFASLLHEAGVPPGRIAVIPGGATTGQTLVEDKRVDVLSFTGGERIGKKISNRSAGRKVLLELGGNNAVVVSQDSDMNEAATACVRGAFSAAGQNCLSVQRVYVQETVIDDFVTLAIEKTKELHVGTKFNTESDVGPLITSDAVESFKKRINEAVDSGARLVIGGSNDGLSMQPTIMTSVSEESELFCEEAFAPLLIITAYKDWTTLPERIHQGGQPMQVGVFSSDVQFCLSLADQIKAGTVLINESSDFRLDSMPFGSFGRSGIGREGVKYTMKELSSPKSIIFSSLRFAGSN